jgi:hypothetical protein
VGGVVGEVDGAAEHVRHAAIHVAAAHDAEPVVHRLWISTVQILELVEAEVPQVPGYAGPDTGGRLEVGVFGGARHAASLVLGSILIPHLRPALLPILPINSIRRFTSRSRIPFAGAWAGASSEYWHNPARAFLLLRTILAESIIRTAS